MTKRECRATCSDDADCNDACITEAGYSFCDEEDPGHDAGCVCTEQWEPVCGLDGETYSNSCFAECVGVAFTMGECQGDSNDSISPVMMETSHVKEKTDCSALLRRKVAIPTMAITPMIMRATSSTLPARSSLSAAQTAKATWPSTGLRSWISTATLHMWVT